MLIVSIRTKERAIPVLWEVVETRGEIGFEIQEPLLRKVAECIPEGTQGVSFGYNGSEGGFSDD